MKLTIAPLKIDRAGVYKIISDDKNIFVNNNGSLLFLNPKTGILDNFYSQVKDAKISPDGKNIVYFTNNELLISALSEGPGKAIKLYSSAEEITDFVWLNKDYIIVASVNKIIISEIDYRGNINTVALPQIITISDKTIETKNPQISFNQQSGKLYILTGGNLLLSEKIIP